MSDKKKVVVLGAGIAGLATGALLTREGYDVTVVDNSAHVGGLCGSFQHEEFVLDYGPHKLYSAIPGVLDDIRDLMGDRLLKLEKRNRIYLKGHLLDYPLRLGNLVKSFGFLTFLQLGFGYAWSVLKSIFVRREPRSYEEYMIKFFGAPAYRLVFEPLAHKTWGHPASLHPEMARTRVPSSGGFELILKLLGLKKETDETNAEHFYYPRKGFGDFPQKLNEDIINSGNKVLTEFQITSISKDGNNVKHVSGTHKDQTITLDCDYLISTIPLSVLSRYLYPNNTQHNVDNLQFRHLILVYIFVDRPQVLNDQWIFFPEHKFPFGRIFEQKQMNAELGPDNKTVICCDLTCNEDSEQWAADDQTLVDKCVEGLELGGFIKANEVTSHLVKRKRNFYPRYDLDYSENLSKAYNQLKEVDNLLLTGRLGMYNYNNSDHCFDMARFISRQLSLGEQPSTIWNNLEEHVKTYKIVD